MASCALRSIQPLYRHPRQQQPRSACVRFPTQSSFSVYLLTIHSPSGSDFPCRSHLSDLGTPAGASVVTWNAGSEYNFTIAGIIDEPLTPAFHNGGSCQAALSYDGGKTWKVIHSYQGACPTSTGGDFKFKVPSDAKTGAAVFAWLWWNYTGIFLNSPAFLNDYANVLTRKPRDVYELCLYYCCSWNWTCTRSRFRPTPRHLHSQHR